MIFAVYFFSLLSLWARPAPAVPDSPITETIQTSLTTGNASQLAGRFAKTIELIIDTEKIDFTAIEATHAQLILRSFFRRHPPHCFEFVYKGASDQLRYSTGTYEADGQLFSVYVLMRQNSQQQYVINTLHFRRE
jgi:hypothetical protein